MVSGARLTGCSSRIICPQTCDADDIQHQQDGRRYLYSPAVSREESRSAATASFVEKICGGSASPLLAWFVEQERISPEELDELRRLIDSEPPKKRRKR